MNEKEGKNDINSSANKAFYQINPYETVEGIKDEFGGLYSCDGKRFIKWLGDTNSVSYAIKEGVEEICDDAFNVNNGYDLEDVDYIGLEIDNVIIPEGVKRIGNRAFFGSSLMQVVLPDSLEEIGDWAFAGCSQCIGLGSIYIPENVKYIGECCFICNYFLSKIEVSPQNKWFCAEGNVLYDKEKTILFVVAPSAKADSVEYKDADCNLSDYANKYVPRREFTIPDTVQTVKSGAFGDCDITKLILHDNIRNVEKQAMGRHECLYIGANINDLPEDNYRWVDEIDVSPRNQMYCIEDGVLYNKERTKLLFCSRRKEQIIIPSSVRIIGSYAFAECGIKKLIVPPGVFELGDYAFRYSKISEITLSPNLCRFGKYVFDGCRGLHINNIDRGSEQKFDKTLRFLLSSYGYNSNFDGFQVGENLPVADYSSLPCIEDLYAATEDIFYIPTGAWNYCLDIAFSDDYDHIHGYLMEISKEAVIEHFIHMKKLLCSILAQGYGLKMYEKKSMEISDDCPTNVACIRWDDSNWLCVVGSNIPKTNYGFLGDFLLLFGVDCDEYLRTKGDVEEYHIENKDYSCCLNKTLVKPVYYEWVDDYVDENSGNVVTVKRREQVLSSGDYIDDKAIRDLKDWKIDSVFVSDGDVSSYYHVLDKKLFVSPEDYSRYLYENVLAKGTSKELEYSEIREKVLDEVLPNILESSDETINAIKDDLINIGLDIINPCCNIETDTNISFIKEVKDAECINGDTKAIIECINRFFDNEIIRYSEMDNIAVYNNFILYKKSLIDKLAECSIPKKLLHQVESIIAAVV